jgi:hypothetical protein
MDYFKELRRRNGEKVGGIRRGEPLQDSILALSPLQTQQLLRSTPYVSNYNSFWFSKHKDFTCI